MLKYAPCIWCSSIQSLYVCNSETEFIYAWNLICSCDFQVIRLLREAYDRVKTLLKKVGLPEPKLIFNCSLDTPLLVSEYL